jgi:hypothetical protein
LRLLVGCAAGRKRLISPIAGPPRSALVAVAATADVEVKIVFLVLVFLEKHVGVVLADVLDILDVLDLGDLVLAGFLGIGFLERDDLGTALGDLVDSGLLFLLLLLALDGGAGLDALLEEGTGIGLASIGRDDRILVQIIEFLARFRVFSFGTAVRIGQFRVPRRQGDGASAGPSG